ncbi:MAG: hypothetical protein QOI42_437 [Frankiaceae bacterium]|jgi:transglutaminase-like putative cysteine protease|nr:hypothetical protein [Frankiaceae bacterium]
MGRMRRSAVSVLVAEVLAPATLELQVAVAGARPAVEQLVVTLDGEALRPRVLATPAGGRMHALRCAPGRLEVTYHCTVDDARLVPPEALDASVYLRPSRYAESDRLTDLAASEFSGITEPRDLVRSVAAWVGGRLTYLGGSSLGTDGAVDTLAAGRGVCRDYAHLTVALLRARDLPARVAAVYAPGLSPMDFHAVAEALIEGEWYVVDATLLAPRQSMMRIATGRDAADIAFLSSYGGDVRLDRLEIMSVVEGPLPDDDIDELVRLA